jgi:FtsP/CotA-like multicopper oxidase with cupredoxin domain
MLPAGLVSAKGGSDSDFDDPSPKTKPFQDELPIPPEAQPVDPFLPDFASYPDGEHAGFPSLHCKEQVWDEEAKQIRANAKFYELVEEEAEVLLHSDLFPTSVWRYRDTSPGAVAFDGVVGPTFRVFMNEPPANETMGGDGLPGGPVIVRITNNLPEDHVGFGMPHMTTHFHGGHQEVRSDGFPEAADGVDFDPVSEPGEHFDYCLALRDTGFSHGDPQPGERPSTLWYHDHLLDFTGPNIYRGLAGFFTVFDELDANDETGTRFPTTNLRLPSGKFDVPLVLKDARLDSDAQQVYLPEDHDGFLGDKFLVNGAIQPFFEVERRKYRFRILDGSNARFYLLVLTDSAGDRQDFFEIGVDSSLLARRLETDRILLSSVQRKEIVIDFAEYEAGEKLYLTNVMEQDDGRGPDGDLKDGIDELLEDSEIQTHLLEFRIVGPVVDDPSDVPNLLRPLEPIPAALLAEAKNNKRRFVFERRRGAWAINGEFVDIDRAVSKPQLNRPEMWILENKSGGWWHPIHVHIDLMRVLKRKGRRPFADEDKAIAKVDTVTLGPNDIVKVFINFRDFPGAVVFHCHNAEHEDMFMMARIDLEPDSSS